MSGFCAIDPHDLDDLALGQRDVLDQRAADRCARCRCRPASPPPACAMRRRLDQAAARRAARGRAAGSPPPSSRAAGSAPGTPSRRRARARRSGPLSWTRLPRDADVAGIRPQPAAEKFDQRALAGAVLADQRMHSRRHGGEGSARPAPARRRTDLREADALDGRRARFACSAGRWHSCRSRQAEIDVELAAAQGLPFIAASTHSSAIGCGAGCR